MTIGGASGIGRATVELFHQNGAYVVFSDVNDEEGIQFEKDLGTYYSNIIFFSDIDVVHIFVQMCNHGHPCVLYS